MGKGGRLSGEGGEVEGRLSGEGWEVEWGRVGG